MTNLVSGETFIGPTTATNRLLVPSNSAVILTATLGDFTNSTEVVLDGFQFAQDFAPLKSGNVYALAGPAELIFTRPTVITYYAVTNSTIHTQGIANDPIGIPVASNRTLCLFGVPAPVNAGFSRPGGGSASLTLEPNQPASFTGPGTLTLSSGVLPPSAKFISYYVAEDGFVLPGQQVVAGPTGSFALSVERSLDLSHWAPVLLENATEPTQAFYRLRFQR